MFELGICKNLQIYNAIQSYSFEWRSEEHPILRQTGAVSILICTACHELSQQYYVCLSVHLCTILRFHFFAMATTTQPAIQDFADFDVLNKQERAEEQLKIELETVNLEVDQESLVEKQQIEEIRMSTSFDELELEVEEPKQLNWYDFIYQCLGK